MLNFYWCKLWIEILDDPKMGRLDDRLWRIVVSCFLMAKEYDQDGFLPELEDMAWRLHYEPEQLEIYLDEIAAQDNPIITMKDGRWFVVNFTKRQAPVDGAERTRSYRERKRIRDAGLTYRHNSGDEPVTDCHTNSDDGVTESHRMCDEPVTNTVTHTETDTEVEKEHGNSFRISEGTPSENSDLADWSNYVRNHKNQQVAVLEMANALYPKMRELRADFGFIGKTMLAVGGVNRMVRLLWDCRENRINGNVFSYVGKMAKNNEWVAKESKAERAERQKPDYYLGGPYSDIIKS
jgi:hypothetical protein